MTNCRLILVRRISPRMNKDYVLYNLDEAHKALGEIIADIRSNRDYDYGEYVVDMSHVYHHWNTAWNAREATKAAADECSEEDFYRWRQFPSEEEIYLGP
jgi:hypothetical protein